MKRVLSIALLAFLFAPASGQQLTASSFYDMYGVLHNPATAGSRQSASIGGTFRKQWDGMPGGPQTGLIFGNGYLKKAKVGLGGYIYNDVTGPTERTGAQLAFAYHIPVSANATFSLGLEGRFQRFSYDKAKLQQSLGANDPVIAGDEQRFKGDAGFGLAFTSSKFQIGASVSQLIQSQLDLYEGTGNVNAESQLYRHYYMHSHYNWDVDPVTRIIPNFLLIYLPNAPTEFQLGARVEHQNLFWYGLTWRVEQAWMISAGLRIKQRFNLGYSFDIYMQPLSVFDRGSNGHEIMLRYDFM